MPAQPRMPAQAGSGAVFMRQILPRVLFFADFAEKAIDKICLIMLNYSKCAFRPVYGVCRAEICV